jgi:uncharacterized cupredoxin-like copper-binding protein
MSNELEHEERASSRSLEAELDEIQRDERALKDRLEKSQLAMLVAVVFAVVASIAALVVGLSKSTSTTTVISRGGGPTSTQSGSGVAASRTVTANLGEMWVRPNASSISAGKVTFVAHNTGQLVHELMVERTPLKMEGPGRPNEKAAIGMIPDLKPGASGRMTLKLKPGTYELFCNVPGHYAAGQHTTFRVTSS